ncbi:MAG TPA: TolC family protein [Terriglobales bacterium]|nr:TolC family protein [Terriglobales bacterium]
MAAPGRTRAAANQSTQTKDIPPLTITLQDALQRARANSPEFNAALTELGVAREDRIQARAALLPGVNYTNQFVYTQGNGTASGRFVANNGVHEYLSQGNAHQVFSLSNIADYRRTRALEAVARARSEIAARGLVVTVVKSYYALVIAQRKYATVQRAADEAERFLSISQKLEHGGEVAHSDVIKAQIQFQQQHRDLQEAQLAMDGAHLDLAVLLFPDFNQNFTVVDDLQSPQPLPSFDEVQSLAGHNNPELRAALSAVHAASQEVAAAWGGLLPSLTLDYFYGIDANHFAINQFDPVSGGVVRNLGYQASATLQIPIWSWGANRSKLKQADLRQRQARVELSFAQRKLLADLRAFYNEAQTARTQLESLGQSAEFAAESLRLTTLRYQGGEATVLEVVDAQNTLTQARNAYDDGQSRFRLAVANLQTLTGSF